MICHTNGNVTYNSDGLLARSKEALPDVSIACMRTSELPLLSHIKAGNSADANDSSGVYS